MRLTGKRRAFAVVAALSLVVVSCGSRLNARQLALFESSLNNRSAAPGASAGGTAPGGGGAVATGPSGASGGVPNGGSGGGVTGPTTTAPGATSSGSAGSQGSGPVAGGSGPVAAGSYFGVSPTGISISPSVCRGAAGGPGVSASEIDIGDVTTITGPIPGLDVGGLHAIQAFVTYVNSLGGICGRRLVLKATDDNFDASQNATATRSIEGSVMALVGSFSAVDQGGATVLQANPGLPDIGEAVTPQRYNIANNFSPMPGTQGLNLAPWLYFKRKYPQAITHMAVLGVNQSTQETLTHNEAQALESIGYKFVYSDYNIELTQTDFSSDAQAMKSAGAQGIFFLDIGSYYADVARAIQDAGLHLTLPAYSENAYDPAFLADGGSAANGTITYSNLAMFQGQDSATNPMVALFNRWYRGLYQATPDQFAAWGWMDGLLFVEGLNAGGGLTRADLMRGLRLVNSFTAGGIESASSPAQKRPAACFTLIDVVNEQWVRDPADPPAGLDCPSASDWYQP